MTTPRLCCLLLLPLLACGAGPTDPDGGDNGGADSPADDTGAPDGDDTGPADSGAEDSAPVDTEDPGAVPTLVSSVPAHGDVGVRADSAVVLVFSEAMDAVSVEAALASFDPAAAPSWNAERTTLTLTPSAPLAYAEGRGNDPQRVDALSYTVEIGAGATSAAGVPLAEPVIVRFQTLKRLHGGAEPVPELTGAVYGDDYDTSAPGEDLWVGDLAGDVGIRSFVTFDLSPLPATVVELESAVWVSTLVDTFGNADNLGPYTEAAHLVFPSLDEEAYWSRVDHDLGYHSTWTDTTVELDATTPVREDLAARVERAQRSQFRISFPTPTNNDHNLDYYAYDADTELVLTYLVP